MKLWIVEFYWGDEKLWEPAIGQTDEEAKRWVVEWYKKDMNTDLDKEELQEYNTYPLQNIGDYKVKLIK